MTKPTGDEITELLWAWRLGDEKALEKLTPQVYRELHRAAKRWMKGERDGHTLQTTGLINALAKVDLRKSQVVEMRFFGGLSVDETAEVLKVPPDTVVRDWRLAKAWLLRELSQENLDGC